MKTTLLKAMERSRARWPSHLKPGGTATSYMATLPLGPATLSLGGTGWCILVRNPNARDGYICVLLDRRAARSVVGQLGVTS